jgi:hypothetical protein
VFGGRRGVRRHRPLLRFVGVVTLAFAALAIVRAVARPETLSLDGLTRALRDPRFSAALAEPAPALFFGVLAVLAPLALDEAGWSTIAIASSSSLPASWRSS